MNICIYSVHVFYLPTEENKLYFIWFENIGIINIIIIIIALTILYYIRLYLHITYSSAGWIVGLLLTKKHGLSMIFCLLSLLKCPYFTRNMSLRRTKVNELSGPLVVLQ
jgi:hypothetical protein